MPAKRPARRYRTSAAPEPDLADIPMTPAMGQLNHVGSTTQNALRIAELCEMLERDLAEVAWAERQRMANILALQRVPFERRAFLSRKLKERGLNLSSEDWRNRRSADVEEQDLPDYLADPEIEKIARQLASLHKRLTRIAEARERQYPAMHKAVVEVIEEHAGLRNAS